uniref:Uncharacterized protein n=1 Tax=Panagrellus redivivus TaxID=6233 RepID=A0A7E4VWI8_PANRE
MSAKLVLICLMAVLIAFTAIDAQYAYEAAYPAYGYNYGTYGAAYGYPYSSYAAYYGKRAAGFGTFGINH